MSEYFVLIDISYLTLLSMALPFKSFSCTEWMRGALYVILSNCDAACPDLEKKSDWKGAVLFGIFGVGTIPSFN